jgi:hypothetical protein
MTPDEKLAAILAAIQTDPGNRGLGKVPGDNLFSACTGDFAAACRSIADHPNPSLAVVTGFFIPTAAPPAHETDGALGAVFLARALSPLEMRSFIATDSAARKAIGIGVEKVGAVNTIVTSMPPARSVPWWAWLELDWRRAVEGYAFTHLVAVERVGPSRVDGHCYTMRARDVTEETAPAHHLFENASRLPRLATIGIGDGGNEIGMGKVSWATVAKSIQNGDRIACRVATDFLIVAGVSNWGAYALAAGVYVLRGVKPPADLFDPDREREILELMVREGPLVDGVTGKQTATVDGLSWEEYVKPLVRIREIVC